MRISHRDLEQARSDPGGFVRGAASGRGPYRTSYFRIWQYAVREYHRRDQDLDAALSYLEDNFRSKFQPGRNLERQLSAFQSHLVNYASEFESLGHTVVDLGVRVSMDLGHGVTMVGEVERVDLVIAGGYGVYLLLRVWRPWHHEVRMPLLQSYFANVFGVLAGIVRVGIYTLDQGRHEVTQYSRRRILDAVKEGSALARQLILAQRTL